jgi:hypothetical protein
MSRKVSFSPIILFSLFVLMAPFLFWDGPIKNPSGHMVFGGQGMIFKYDWGSQIFYTGLMLLMFFGGGRGLYKRVKREGAVAPLKITFAAICGSFVLLGGLLLEDVGPDSFLARFYERQTFRYVVFIFLLILATIVLLATALKEQRRTKSTTAVEQSADPSGR